MDQNSHLHNAANQLRTWGGVALIGAGVSLRSGFPLRLDLNNLLWHAIDRSELDWRRLIEKDTDESASAREIVGDDPRRVALGYALLRKDERARQAFQEAFVSLDRERRDQFSPVHNAIVQMVHRGTIKIVISLNWDSLLETAYRRRYGVSLVVGGPIFYKPHGDVAHPELPWTLPDEEGAISDQLLSQVQFLASDHPRVLLVIGYGERDEEVVRKLIRPIEKNWRVIRVGPEVTGETDICASAEDAIPALVSAIYSGPEIEGWEYVNFDVQHGLADALLGRRLGPADVVACPQLPEVDAIFHTASVSSLALVSGASGTGKSISVYQAAYRFHQKGTEVIRAVFEAVSPDRAIDKKRGMLS